MIYIDLTSLISVKFMTGIQRVVSEVVMRFIKESTDDITLLAYDDFEQSFYIIDKMGFVEYYLDNSIGKKKLVTNDKVNVSDISVGTAFFDIDSVWNNHLKRSYLYMQLKKQGAKIATLIYDIIPITHPQYCHMDTVTRFINYFGACLKYADLIITNTESTKEHIRNIEKQITSKKTHIEVVALGSDFRKKEKKEKIADKVIKEVVNKKYCLMVGTIEPRKNHEFVLDVFEKGLFDEGITLVFAGKIGWNVSALEKRVRELSKSQENFLFFENLNDESIDYLYKNAFVSIMASHNEGFGLPIIESIERGTPVFASNIGVFKEVAGGLAEFFDLDETQELYQLISKYACDEKAYNELKNNLVNFKKVKWDDVTTSIHGHVSELVVEKKVRIGRIKQMVILSARPEMLLETIPYIENYMAFIKELVIICPERLVDSIKEEYDGTLSIEFLTDEMLVGNETLSTDHVSRNFMLRCLAMKHEGVIDNEFIMADDDNRPLRVIDESVFINNDTYVAYYFYSLEKWRGAASNITSYDRGMFITRDFLNAKKLPTLQYSSHMPQIINKSIFCQMLAEYPEIVGKAYDEWSLYFNYATYMYPTQFSIEKYKTLCWPSSPLNWNQLVEQDDYYFENYYEENYAKEGIFYGFAQVFSNMVLSENLSKIKRYEDLIKNHRYGIEGRNAVNKLFEKIYNEKPNYYIEIKKDMKRIVMPKFYVAKSGVCNKLYFEAYMDEEGDTINAIMRYAFSDCIEGKVFVSTHENIQVSEGVFELPLVSPLGKGDYRLRLTMEIGEDSAILDIPALIY